MSTLSRRIVGLFAVVLATLGLPLIASSQPGQGEVFFRQVGERCPALAGPAAARQGQVQPTRPRVGDDPVPNVGPAGSP